MFFFFFSSRRRHTRSLRDWSSDVCSSDLKKTARKGTADQPFAPSRPSWRCMPRSEERRVGKGVDLGGRRIIKKKKKIQEIASGKMRLQAFGVNEPTSRTDTLSLRIFFFSSRRRHTRSLRDWSSDVCSSDLPCKRSSTCRDTAVVSMSCSN